MSTTIVMPYYKKYLEFTSVFEKFNIFEINKISGAAVFIVMDDPSGHEDLLQYLMTLTKRAYLNFSIKVFLNRAPHAWRCPSVAINVGTRNSIGARIIVLSPETIICQNSLIHLTQYKTHKNYCTGMIKHAKYSALKEVLPDDFFNNAETYALPYGSICFDKSQAEKVGGYDEDFRTWGGDDDDFRYRLSLAGFHRTQTLAKFLHVKFESEGHNHCPHKTTAISHNAVQEKIQAISKNKNYLANRGLYGLEFDEIIFECNPTAPAIA